MKGDSDHVEYFDNRKANRFGYERLERVAAHHDIYDADIPPSKPNNVSLLKSLSASVFGRTAPAADDHDIIRSSKPANNVSLLKSLSVSMFGRTAPDRETMNKNYMMNNKSTSSSAMSRSKSVSGGNQENPKVAKKLAKTHPLFGISFMDMRRSKKAMAKPEFLRYVEYMKEGGRL